MGINPGDCTEERRKEGRRKILDEMFRPNESPYFKMHSAGKCGIPIDEVIDKLTSIGIPVRAKDIQAWQDGMFKYQMQNDPMFAQNIQPNVRQTVTGISLDEAKLSDFPMFPQSWLGTERRFFPCTNDNKPMQKWGWSPTYSPQLYDIASAKALSPCGWVGQNMLYQRFIVIDIDGRGHGSEDLETIAWGEQWKDKTWSMEDPSKPGSFHLYFVTDRLIPVRHFPWAKIDLMGNDVNAAVYLKNKIHNGLPMMQLDESIWQSLQEYQNKRKEK